MSRREADRPRPGRTSGNPLRPSPDQPTWPESEKISGALVDTLFDLVRRSGALERLPSDTGRPGPKGLDFRTVLVGLLLAQYKRYRANLDDAWELLFLGLSTKSKRLLGIPDLDLTLRDDMPEDEGNRVIHLQYATSKRVYGAWKSMNRRLDPAPHNRRKRITIAEAEAIRAQWADPANEPMVRNLEAIAQDLIMAPVKSAVTAGLFRRWPGDVAMDDTPLLLRAQRESAHDDRASLEITAGLYKKGGSKKNKKGGDAKKGRSTGTRRGVANESRQHSGERATGRAAASGRARTAKKTSVNKAGGKQAKAKEEPDDNDLIFAYALMLTTTTHAVGDLAGTYPKVTLGMILRTPGTEPGRAAMRSLHPSYEHGMARGLVCADRGISQAKAEDFDIPLLGMGLGVVKHYNDDQVDLQGEYRGMHLIGGRFYCPLMPQALATAGAIVVDVEADKAERLLAREQVRQRRPYATKLKQSGPNGDERRSCPSLGPHPTVTCYRRTVGTKPQTVIDLDAPLPRTAHALPHIAGSANETGPHPSICTQASVTVPGTVLAKHRQAMAVLDDDWQQAWSRQRSQNEGHNGILKKGYSDDLSDPDKRLSPGRVSQTILVAITLCVANMRAIEVFRRSRYFKAIKSATQPTKRESAQAGQEPSLPPSADVHVEDCQPSRE
ncbi:hypothetical protein ACFV4P_26900 [Kitasatospora sp. NPDC059795]|uniref:hypothetical protein n=1 Tax=Kitasatospora sp. NPDC059795 TaxID=3346949 RepID=UPI00365BD685